MTKNTLSRRHVLKAMGASFILPFAGQVGGLASPAHAAGNGGSQRINAFLAIHADSHVEVMIAQAEMGQGITTGLTQVVADELGAEWETTQFKITTEMRPEFLNPVLYGGARQITGGSTSMVGFFMSARQAAASAREMLIAAAAQVLEVPADQLRTEAGQIVGGPRAVPFGEVAAMAARLSVPAEPRLKEKTEFQLIGQPHLRKDVPAKIDGTAMFGIDHKVDGMLWAAVKHGSLGRADVESFDDSAAREMPGVRLIMPVPAGIAVVADHYWQAAKALEAVEVTYRNGAATDFNQAELESRLVAGLNSDGVDVPGAHGDVDTAFANAAQIIEATYEMPAAAHAVIEPVSCTAHVTGDRCKLWLSTQAVTVDAGHAAEVLGIDVKNVEVHNEFMGGAFGRRSGREHIAEAVLLSREVGAPVKVIWSREEDMLMDQFRSAAKMRGRLALDAAGRPTGFDAAISQGGFWESLFPDWYEQVKPLDVPMFGLIGTPYSIPNETGRYARLESPMRYGAWRGNNENTSLLLREHLIDEAAHAASLDPMEYRLSMISDARSRAVLERAAELSRWRDPARGTALGVSFMHSEDLWKTRVAVVAEIEAQGDDLQMSTLYCVCDSGLVINPLLARMNLEGALLFGLSWAMYEELTFEAGAPAQRNFGDYEILRIDQSPELVIDIIEGADEPGAFGEVATPVVPAAVGNAIFEATGERLRKVPFARHGARFA